MLRIDVVTIFPELFPGPLAASIPGRALERGLAELNAHDLREWGLGRHRSVDDYPYGGGAGMILRVEPIAGALAALATPATTRILLDPGGARFDQQMARDLAAREHLLLVCPRYEGVDARVREMVDLELSIGDYVLSGGELPAMVVIDAVLRLLPGAIDEASPVEESFSAGLLEYPQFTRPPEFEGREVPDVLLSGNHGAVDEWRRDQATVRTRANRPDLLKIGPMSDPTPYLLFAGTAREALTFYAATFGCATELHTFAEMGRSDGPGDAIGHGYLTGGPVRLFAADVAGDEQPFRSEGLMFSLLGTAAPSVLRQWFARLSEGGQVIDDLQRRPWGASDGLVVDPFGVRWLIGFEQDEDA